MDRTDIINLLAKKIEARTYLEIGVRDGENFHKVNCPRKIGVDPDPNSAATHFMTSDEFFEKNTETFDIIFIDGLHLSEQLLADLVNSLKVLSPTGYIICHDINPPTEELQRRINPSNGNWNGDCWKAFVYLRWLRDDLVMYTVDTDWGCGVISKGTPGVQEDFPFEELSWDSLVKNREKWLTLISANEFIARL